LNSTNSRWQKLAAIEIYDNHRNLNIAKRHRCIIPPAPQRLHLFAKKSFLMLKAE
jgi:hypothetical protein